jgi:tetratricopeptide (TPR) repeat protein
VRDRGGSPRRGITKGTGVLVVGELGWPILADGQPSKSLTQAQAQGIPVVSERRFLEWLGRSVPEEQARSYAPDQLAALSKLPIGVVEQLAMFGLIEPRDGLYGFRDLAAARQLAELLGSGITLSAITRSLKDIRKWLPDAQLSRLRLFPAAADAVLVEQLQGRTDKSGQFVLPVDEPDHDADSVFDQAQAAQQREDTETAERLYRRVLKIDPRDAAAAFNLGNLLRMSGRQVEAEAAFRAATKADASFAEAWYNLADLLDERAHPDEAIACLKRALDADPAYADAMFNLALMLQRREKHTDAAVWWRRYLQADGSSPWAERAKRALKYCEMLGK